MAKFNEKNFGNPSGKAYTIEELLSEGEQLLWRGKPNRKAYILSQVFRMLPFALLWLLVDGFMIGMMIRTEAFSQMGAFVVVIIVFFAFHLIPVWIWLSNVITAGARHKNIEYAFTNTRIIIRSGLIGIDIVNLYYADVSNVNLKVGLTDRIMHVGDVYISGIGKAQVLWDIDNPYEVVAKLQKIVNDIKTDTFYPNNLRPGTNDGYQTRYTGKP